MGWADAGSGTGPWRNWEDVHADGRDRLPVSLPETLTRLALDLTRLDDPDELRRHLLTCLHQEGFSCILLDHAPAGSSLPPGDGSCTRRVPVAHAVEDVPSIAQSVAALLGDRAVAFVDARETPAELADLHALLPVSGPLLLARIGLATNHPVTSVVWGDRLADDQLLWWWSFIAHLDARLEVLARRQPGLPDPQAPDRQGAVRAAAGSQPPIAGDRAGVRATLLASAVRTFAARAAGGRTCDVVTRLLVPAFGDLAAVYLQASDGARYELAALRTATGRAAMLRAALRRLPLAEPAPGAVAVLSQALLVPDARSDPRIDHDVARRLDLSSVIIVPVMVQRKPAGVLLCASQQSGLRYDPDDLELAALVADVAAGALERARLDARQRRASADAVQARAILDAAHFGVAIVLPDGAIATLNPAARALLDMRPRAQTTLRDYAELDPRLPSGEPVPVDRFPLAGAPAGVVVGDLDFSIRTRTGLRRECGLTGVPVRDSRGALRCMLYVFRDVSARRRLDRQKMEFFSVASHELKTPLTNLKGYLQSLARRIDRQPDTVSLEDVQERLHRMGRQIDRLTDLINDILDVSRAQAGKLALRLEPVDLREVVHDVLDRTLPPDADGSAAHPVEIDLPDGPVLGTWDRDRIEQVVTNLLSNAAKYSIRGAPITVTVTESDDSALLVVTDHGIGVPGDEQAQLFQPFFRARNAPINDYGGIGLGLFIAHELVTRHGGTMSMTSEEGQGSVVRVRLPRKPPDSSSGAV